MCWMCDAYGEEGGRWYLNPKNFARQLYKVKRPGQKAAAYGTDPETQAGLELRNLVAAKWEDPDNFEQRLKEFKEKPKEGGCQVLPLKEAMHGQGDVHVCLDVAGVDVEVGDADLLLAHVAGDGAVGGVAPGGLAPLSAQVEGRLLAFQVDAGGGEQREAALVQRFG